MGNWWCAPDLAGNYSGGGGENLSREATSAPGPQGSEALRPKGFRTPRPEAPSPNFEDQRDMHTVPVESLSPFHLILTDITSS
ncbi:hypothetical protein J41TS12_07530 [Paenibacillus antibioticophila]|uniref:Uncharacterized protein n=1 Tax=Paenibacillus antibioticophila TaxID=1274374 RepID=A0A920CGN8_9BACL|nr:hypothetical protein J41TS12_07530 [Paenibacillus antibioticophila]